MRSILMALAATAVLVLTIAPAHAQQWTVPTKNATKYVHLRKETGIWTLSVYVEKKGEMQTRLLEKTFTEEKEARRTARKLLKSYGYEEPNADDGPKAAPVVAGSTNPVFITEVPGESIWTATKNWNWDYEMAFAKWVTTIDNQFFSRYGIATDCADVAVGLRWIFARMHGLPAGNTLAGSNRLVTQGTFRKAWLGLQRGNHWYGDELFVTVLNYLFDNTYTKSILWDGYPVAINQKSFTTGVFHLEFHSEGGHTVIVNDLQTGGFFSSASMKVFQSTLPREVRDLWQSDYLMSEQPNRATGGFFRMRWPVKGGKGWILSPEENHPDYSLEQYEPSFMNAATSFSSAVKQRLANKYDLYGDYHAGLVKLWELLETRVNTVETGFVECQKISCAPGTKGWDAYSTPVRDSKIKGLITMAAKTAKEHGSKDARIVQEWNQFVMAKMLIDGKEVLIDDVFLAFLKDKASSDPRHSVSKRWGLEK